MTRHRGLFLALPFLALTASLICASPTPALAQADAEPLPAEIGVFGRFTGFDNDIEFDNAFGPGGRVMAFFLPRWGFEVDGAYADADGPARAPDVAYFTAHVRGLYGLPIATRSQLLFGLGYVHNNYGKDVPHWGDGGVGGLVGLRIGLNTRWAVRFDATYDFMPNSADLWDLGHLGLQAGIGWNPLYRHPTRPGRGARVS